MTPQQGQQGQQQQGEQAGGQQGGQQLAQLPGMLVLWFQVNESFQAFMSHQNIPYMKV